MKKTLLLIALAVASLSCKTENKQEVKEIEVSKKTQEKVYNFPENLGKVLEKHGGIKAWDTMKTLSYKLKDETHTVDLHSRKTIVAAKDYSLGFDGKEVWLAQQDSTAFTRDPKFYYNLFFYFYAMPFVLADEGIVYEDVEPFVHENISYPGIKISYKANVGTSPDDNYFVYYNPETYQMEWLGYTVTYRSKKPSDKVKMIRYNDWEDVNGFVLPKSITWYKKDEGSNEFKATEKMKEFLSPKVSKSTMEDDFYKNKNE